jgi:hypothetical protein
MTIKYDKDGNAIDDDFEDVSDEDFAKMSLESFEGSPEEDKDTVLDTVDDKDIEDTTTDTDLDEDDKEDDVDPDVEEDDETTEPEKEVVSDEIDYKAEYEKMLKGFSADGDTIVPKSVDDLLALAQQGVTSQGKLKNKKPARVALKTLQNNGLTEEGALDFLIDLKAGDPKAIHKLLKDHQINLEDINLEAESDYTPGNYQASEGEVKLDEVLDAIAGSQYETQTLDVVTKQWDQASQRQAGLNPQIISVINEHIGNGVYDKVSKAVKYERSMGRLDGVSDFEAYMNTGETMEKAGLLTPTAATVKQAAAVVVEAAPKVPDVKEAARKAAKKKALVKGNKRVAKKATMTEDEIFALSDEEFSKLDKKQFGL